MEESQKQVIEQLQAALRKVVRGKDEVIELLLVGVLAGGHVLIEDVPGVGKTTLAKAMAQVCDMGFARVQFTPDLLPSDILGTEILNPEDHTFTFHGGPVFTNVLLADEINRASPRTQSALLEAMNEQQVTIEGTSRPLPSPFFVIATQNPVDFQGTYPLPEAQLDRFLLRLTMGYPPIEDELKILLDRRLTDPLEALKPVANGEQLLELQMSVRRVELNTDVARYLLEVVTATRNHRDLELGCSPRGALALYRAAQARALVLDRDYVTPADIQSMGPSVLAHRVLPTQQARYGGTGTDAIIAEVIDEIPVPT